MKIKRALIVYKKSRYQKQILEDKTPHLRRLVQRRDITVRTWRRLHDEHLRCLQHVKDCLQRWGIPFRTNNRFAIKPPLASELIITVGGDGTFLEAAHHVGQQWMFGVNSTPSRSVGHFLAVSATGFERKLRQVLAGQAKTKTLQRLQAFRGRTKLGPPALNEILFSSQNAGATSRYWIRIREGSKRGPREEQKSSGIWIATPAGSSAAIHSAGGRRLPMEAIRFSYRVRELYRQRGVSHRIHSGILGLRASLEVTPMMDDAALFIDGPHVVVPVARGETVTFKLSSSPIRIVA